MFKNLEDKRWNIPKDWEWVNMQDIADVTGGGTPKSDDKYFDDDGGIPWITPDDLTSFSDIYK